MKTEHKIICKDCKKDISKRWWNTKRCFSCQRNRHISNMKRYRDSHKKEIRKYQREYYSKEENKRK